MIQHLKSTDHFWRLHEGSSREAISLTALQCHLSYETPGTCYYLQIDCIGISILPPCDEKTGRSSITWILMFIRTWHLPLSFTFKKQQGSKLLHTTTYNSYKTEAAPPLNFNGANLDEWVTAHRAAVTLKKRQRDVQCSVVSQATWDFGNNRSASKSEWNSAAAVPYL